MSIRLLTPTCGCILTATRLTEIHPEEEGCCLLVIIILTTHLPPPLYLVHFYPTVLPRIQEKLGWIVIYKDANLITAMILYWPCPFASVSPPRKPNSPPTCLSVAERVKGTELSSPRKSQQLHGSTDAKMQKTPSCFLSPPPSIPNENLTFGFLIILLFSSPARQRLQASGWWPQRVPCKQRVSQLQRTGDFHKGRRGALQKARAGLQKRGISKLLPCLGWGCSYAVFPQPQKPRQLPMHH